MSKNYKYFKHITKDGLIATQCNDVNGVNSEPGEALFETQLIVCGKMHSSIKKFKVDEFIEITNDEFNQLITKL